MGMTWDNELLYARMALIRRFEERVLEEYAQGALSGTTHCCIGQEADAVGVCAALGEGDLIFSNHRGHGHFLARYADPAGLAAEIMGRESGVCRGCGGSQHLWRPGLLSNGIQGGIAPNACGAALAEKMMGGGAVVVVFLGDGTMGQGVVYEALNMAALWSAPLFVVVENNHYAQSTPVEQAMAGSLAGRFTAFGVGVRELDGADVLEIAEAASELIGAIRSGSGPRALIIDTYRYCAHSKGDDTRCPEEIAAQRKRDPLLVHGRRIPDARREALEVEALATVEAAFAEARSAPPARGREGA